MTAARSFSGTGCLLCDKLNSIGLLHTYSAPGISSSPFVEHPAKLISDRFEQIAHHCTTAGLQENLDRHARDQGQAFQTPTFAADEVNSHDIEAGVALLVVAQVGRDV
jgi:hypothetical protein